MKTLLDSVSIPREASKANQLGLIYDPLVTRISQALHLSRYTRTLNHISTNGMLLKEDSPSPSIVGHMYTNVESVGESSIPSSDAALHSLQTSGVFQLLFRSVRITIKGVKLEQY